MSLFRKRREEYPGEESFRQIMALDDETLAPLVFPRMVHQYVSATLQPSARPFVPAVLPLLAVDLPEQVGVPPEWFWERRGGLDRWWAIARRNVVTLLDEPSARVESAETAGGVVTTYLGPSPFVASLALRFDEVLRHVGHEDRGHGALAVMPNIHQLAWHVVEGGEARELIEAMFHFARSSYRANDAAALSPVVHWARGDRWQPIASVHGDQVMFDPPAELIAAMGLT